MKQPLIGGPSPEGSSCLHRRCAWITLLASLAIALVCFSLNGQWDGRLLLAASTAASAVKSVFLRATVNAEASNITSHSSVASAVWPDRLDKRALDAEAQRQAPTILLPDLTSVSGALDGSSSEVGRALEALCASLNSSLGAMTFFGFGDQAIHYMDASPTASEALGEFLASAHGQEGSAKTGQFFSGAVRKLHRLRTRVKNHFGTLQPESVASGLESAMEGLEFWLDAHLRLHFVGSQDFNTRRNSFLSAIAGMGPSLKEGFTRLSDWIITGSVATSEPLLLQLAGAMGKCEQNILAYATYLYATLFQAGLAFCEFEQFMAPGLGAQCDVSWSLAVLPRVRHAVHRQASLNFGLDLASTATCFSRELFQASYSGLTVDGPCHKCTDSRCFQSPNYPADYDNGQECTIYLPAGDWQVDVQHFDTEENYDFLEVGGRKYSGTEGPPLVVATGNIRWTSDVSDVASGWKICLSRPASSTYMSSQGQVPWVLMKHLCGASAPGSHDGVAESARREVNALLPHISGYSNFYLATWQHSRDDNFAGWIPPTNHASLFGTLPASCARSVVYTLT